MPNRKILGQSGTRGIRDPDRADESNSPLTEENMGIREDELTELQAEEEALERDLRRRDYDDMEELHEPGSWRCKRCHCVMGPNTDDSVGGTWTIPSRAPSPRESIAPAARCKT